MVLSDGPPEESFAAVAGGGAVVLACGAVPADGALLLGDAVARPAPRAPAAPAAPAQHALTVAPYRHLTVWNNKQPTIRKQHYPSLTTT